MESMVERFVRYTSINTRSNEESTTIPSTQTQVDFATNVLVPDLKAIGLDELFTTVKMVLSSGTLNANTDEKAPAIGFIAHMDTADYNAENVKPRIVENYDGSDICLNEEHQIFTRRADFPNLKNYIGKSLVVTDGLTLLGGDDKAGICEIMEALAYLVAHPEIKHGKIMCLSVQTKKSALAPITLMSKNSLLILLIRSMVKASANLNMKHSMLQVARNPQRYLFIQVLPKGIMIQLC